jgi:uncharacterized protein
MPVSRHHLRRFARAACGYPSAVSGAVAEEEVGRPAAVQEWRSVAFLHWRYEPVAVARLLPQGLEPDLYDGDAWVGLTPFVVRERSIAGIPTVFALQGLTTFPETNLRTYVRGPDGRDGIWFFSLDVDSLATTIAARTLYQVPYMRSEMQVDDDGDIRYRARRPRRPDIGHDLLVRPGAALTEPEPLVDFLTGRWRAWTKMAGRLATVAVQHEPWPLATADLLRGDETITAAAGLPTPASAPMVHYSPGVTARIGTPRLASRAAGPRTNRARS